VYIEKRITADKYGELLGIAFGSKCSRDYGCEPIQMDDFGHYSVPEYLVTIISQYRDEIQKKTISRGYYMDEANYIADHAVQCALKRIDDTACGRTPNTYLNGRFPVGEPS